MLDTDTKRRIDTARDLAAGLEPVVRTPPNLPARNLQGEPP